MSRVRGLLIANLLAQIAFGLLAMTVCLPSMPEWGRLFDAEQASVQLTFSSYVFAFASLQVLYGPLSDRFGRRRILLIGLALAAAGSLLALLARDLSSLIVARVVQGAGSAAGMVVSRALVQDEFQGAERTRVMAYVGMAMGFGPPLAILLGGQIHVHLGWRANFGLMALVSLVLMLAAWRGLPSRRPTPPGESHWLRAMAGAYARLAREPVFWLYVVIVAMTTATFYTFLGGAPLVLRGYGIGPDQIGWYVMFVSVAYVVGNFLTSHLIHRLGEGRLMALGQGTSLAGLGLVVALGLLGYATPLALVAPLILLGLGHGFTMPAALAGSVGVVPALAGAAAAVAGLLQQSMGAVGGYVVGWVPHEGALNLGLLMLTFTLCGVGAQLLLHRGARR